MGRIKHNSLIVTDWKEENVIKAHEKAKEIYEFINEGSSSIISPIIGCLANGQSSFFIAPDGSKEGWDTSDLSDKARNAFMDWMKSSGLYLDYIDVRFGGDDEICDIVRDNDSDLN